MVKKIYDNKKYEEQLHYFNRNIRRRYYKHDIECYGHCYDCYLELIILTNYINLFTNNTLCNMKNEINKCLKRKI